MTASDSVLELLDKLAVVLEADTTIVQKFTTRGRICTPRLLPSLAQAEYPAILMAPLNSPEIWVTNYKREVRSTIEVYVVNHYPERTQDVRHCIERIKNVADVLRGHRLSDYLSKPIQIDSIDYDTLSYGDENRAFFFVATITLDCRRLFIGT